MKRYSGIQTVLIRVSGQQRPVFTALMENAMAAKKALVEPGLTVYQLPDGGTVQLYCAGAHYPPYLFAQGDVVIGYRVNNVKQAIEELTAEGASLLGEVTTLCADNCYCFLQMQDGCVIGLYQV